MACANWDNGACLIGVGGGRPTHGVCVICSHNTDKAWHAAQIKENQAAETAISHIAVPQAPAINSGIGDALAATLARMGFKKTPGCNCQSLQTRLNGLTPAEALAQSDSLAAQLVANYKPGRLLRLPVLVVARWLVRRAAR